MAALWIQSKIWKKGSLIYAQNRYFWYLFQRVCEGSFEDLEINSNWKFQTQISALYSFGEITQKFSFNPHMHEIFSQRYCMKWVPGHPQKKMLN